MSKLLKRERKKEEQRGGHNIKEAKMGVKNRFNALRHNGYAVFENSELATYYFGSSDILCRY